VLRARKHGISFPQDDRASSPDTAVHVSDFANLL
jgi:hypothetical protein